MQGHSTETAKRYYRISKTAVAHVATAYAAMMGDDDPPPRALEDEPSSPVSHTAQALSWCGCHCLLFYFNYCCCTLLCDRAHRRRPDPSVWRQSWTQRLCPDRSAFSPTEWQRMRRERTASSEPGLRMARCIRTLGRR
mgnify:CR=1 FL=1